VTEPAKLVALRARDKMLTLLFERAGSEISVDLPVEERTLHALHHVTALHGHQPACGQRLDVHVGLLIRALAATDALPDTVVVRPGPPAAFWLRLRRDGRLVDVDLDVLDAACLLMSQRLPVRFAEELDWDAALRRLVDGAA
jgi:hypothetical protein